MATLAEVKTTQIELMRDWAVTLLRRSDHHVIKQYELSVEIPEEIVAKRVSIRDHCTTVENAINDATDSAAVIEVAETIGATWPTDG